MRYKLFLENRQKSLHFLYEAKKSFFMNKTDEERIRRAQQEMRTNPPSVTDAGEGLEKLEFNFKANPSVEMKRHHGYVVYDPENNDIKELWCDCLDHFYRLWAPMVDAGFATWEDKLPKKYQKKVPRKHNHDWTKIRNPSGKLFVCKHLYALMDGYIN